MIWRPFSRDVIMPWLTIASMTVLISNSFVSSSKYLEQQENITWYQFLKLEQEATLQLIKIQILCQLSQRPSILLKLWNLEWCTYFNHIVQSHHDVSFVASSLKQKTCNISLKFRCPSKKSGHVRPRHINCANSPRSNKRCPE